MADVGDAVNSTTQNAAGGAWGGPVGMGIGAAVGLAGSLIGANAAKKAAQEQAAAADRYRQWVGQQMDTALGEINSPSRLAAYDKALQSQSENVSRMQTLAQSLSPNLIEVGKQLHGMLQGQSAPVLKNLNDQRALQRQQLVDRINTQMGPGGASSTAGQQALNEFDQQTANLTSQAQNEYLSKFMDVSLQSPRVMNALGGASTQLAQINEMAPSADSARLRASFVGGPGAQAAQMGMQTAGASQAGNSVLASALGGLGQMGMAIGGMMMGKNANNTQNPSGGGGQPALKDSVAWSGNDYGGFAGGVPGMTASAPRAYAPQGAGSGSMNYGPTGGMSYGNGGGMSVPNEFGGVQKLGFG